MPGADSPLAALEALIFASTSAVTQAELKRALGWTPGQIAAGVQDINKQLETTGRPYEIVEVSGGYRFRTRPEFGEFLALAQPERRVKLSRASLDTLAVIAYRQPISRPEIEEIRSVDSGAVVRGLLDRGLVRIVGRRDAPGRPALYGTSAQFLEIFGLSSLRDLPDLRDLLPSGEVEATPIEAAIARRGSEAAAEALEADLDAADSSRDEEADAASSSPELDVEALARAAQVDADEAADGASAGRDAAAKADGEPEAFGESEAYGEPEADDESEAYAASEGYGESEADGQPKHDHPPEPEDEDEDDDGRSRTH